MSSIDYSAFTVAGTPASRVLNKKWWELDKKDDVAAAIFGLTRYLQQNQSARTTQMLTSTRLYGNLSLMGLNGLTFSKIASVTSRNTARITYNVCQAATDTVTSKIAKNKPKPLFLTSGGDYKLQHRAEELTKFVDGILYENKGHDLGVEIFRDACVFGTGAVHVYPKHGRIKLERVLITEIIIDEVEAFYGEPRNMYRVKNVDRGVLIGMFPKAEKDIMAAMAAKPDDIGGMPTVSDEVSICEAWHLPSAPDAHDGRHVISLPGRVLFEEEWDKDYFPIAFFHWSKKLFGFWGQGLIEQIQNIQLEINKLLWVVQRSMHLMGSFKILVENGSKIVKEHLNNDIGAIVAYTGTPPQYITPPVVSPEVYNYLQSLKQDAFSQAGISLLSAAAQKPKGLNSGAALREYNDIESDRFMTIGQAYESLFVDLAKLIVKCAKEIEEAGGELAVKVPGKKFIETVNWADVAMEEDQYVLQIYPVSSLPNEPAGRLETIQELMQAGLIDPEAGRRLLDYPDLESEESLNNAELDYLHEVLDDMVQDGKYVPPEPFDDLQRARKLALEYYAKGKCNGLEEEKLELIRRFIGQIDALQQAALAQAQAAQPQQPQQGAAGAPSQPMAQPLPQPQSPLLSVIPGGQP